MTLPSFFLRSAPLLGALLLGGCNFAPTIFRPDAGKADSGTQPTTDGGVMRTDAGLAPADACPVLNGARCAYFARCGLIDNDAQARQDCERGLEATWCGPLTWPSHVAAGALRYDPLKAEACAQSFLTQACSEWTTPAESCTRFLVPRVPLGQPCYDGFAECTDGVCGGSSCPRTCQPRALLDEPCTIDGECRTGLYCKLSPFMPNSGRCAAYGMSGAGCESSRDCLEGLRCVGQYCTILPTPGSDCLEGQCSETGYCDPQGDAGLCLTRKQEGAGCVPGQCQTGLVCDPIRDVCVKVRLSSGDLCSLAQQCPPGEVCLAATGQMAGLCHAPQPEGDPCFTHGDCEAHLACQEADGGRACQRRAEEGAACDSSQSCRASAQCAAASCTELPLPGQSCAESGVCRWGLCRALAGVDGGAVCGPLLSASQPCQRNEECSSGACSMGACLARCVP